MKKFLSMFLVLTMVVTTLMGIMVTDVSAVTVSKNEETGVYEITMGPTAQTKLGGVGTYVIKGNQNTDFMPFAEISEAKILGKDYIYYDFEQVTVNDSSLVTSNYLRFPIVGKQTEGSYNTADVINTVPKDTFLNDIKNGKYYKLSFYGYSKTGEGQALRTGYNRGDSMALYIDLAAANVKSEAEIPHRIDVIAYGNSEGTYAYETVYVDGVVPAGGRSYDASNYTQNTVKFISFIQPITLDDKIETYTSKVSDYVFENFSVRDSKVDLQVLTKEELDQELFVNITPNTGNKGTQISTARTDDYITGVTDEVDKAIILAVTNTTAGDRIAELPKTYTTVGSIYTDKANSNVKAVDKTTGAPAEDTAALSDVLLMVDGVYVTAVEKPDWVEDPEKYAEDANKPFSITAEQDGNVYTRIRMNDYTVNPAPDALGGIDTGFYKFTSEPRGSFTFDKGTVKYNDLGYYGLKTPSSATTSFEKSRYITLEFDMYMSGYDINDGATYLSMALGRNSSTRAQLSGMYFVTKESDKAKTNGVGTILTPNAWNSVKIELDFLEAENGVVTARVYANGETEPQQTVVSPSDNTAISNIRTMYQNNMQRIDYARLYPTKYTSVGIMNNRWYFGRTESEGLDVSTTDIDVTGIDDITADNSTNRLIWNGTDEEALITAMTAKGYTPVYNYTYASADMMNAAYDEVDGVKPEADPAGSYTYSGTLVNRWIEATESYDAGVANGVSASSKSANATRITSITKDGDNYTMTLTANFGDTTVYPGICTSMDDILAAKPELRTKTLSGFAVTDSGKMPRVYTLISGTTKLNGIVISDTGLATLYFDRYDDSTLNAYMIIAALDTNGKLIDVTAKDVADEYSAATGMEQTITLQSNASEGVRVYRALLVDNFENITPLVNRAYKLITE